LDTFIGIINKKGIIKVVEYLGEGDLTILGVELMEYLKDRTDAARIVKTTVDYIDDGYIYHIDDDHNVYEEYEDVDDLLQSIDIEENLYYIYDNCWMVVGYCLYDELTELDCVLE